ncbi:hypothetical protein PHYBLDRAFT_160253 [Phycomyces blakesleeanus NRRL 1555(-)]|uniref:Uncharacterized protein n=1 Tax=Phycomyces blakesleeanus (strain ATCC 8743b / DSM 1359 / FGSC 10004 / NBRC 33097 / NRRL 1555) TaxID=763407 RepID=A0A162TFH0_PHYB8|nr:hypothetical protein PHYBLDRAFT_160253 [Phycomyces blakesleeanus NRRL 1555(-)]OAD68172.1 hypothetical protein PHYBLDRAFT_160253 [Phycomyces blakesleeanus NRRL 1555(-)]|eukprot:XP_018286212.1 hypothetical protein PHYBLDRAFT_160253 [Phycomyces blakesleeanus NRRL 1555(-)]
MNVVMKTDDHRTVTTAGTLPQSGAIRHGSRTGRHCCEARVKMCYMCFMPCSPWPPLQLCRL